MALLLRIMLLPALPSASRGVGPHAQRAQARVKLGIIVGEGALPRASLHVPPFLDGRAAYAGAPGRPSGGAFVVVPCSTASVLAVHCRFSISFSPCVTMSPGRLAGV